MAASWLGAAFINTLSFGNCKGFGRLRPEVLTTKVTQLKLRITRTSTATRNGVRSQHRGLNRVSSQFKAQPEYQPGSFCYVT